MKRLMLVATVVAAVGCTKKSYDIDLDKLSSFRVTLTSGNPGSPDAPYPYTPEPVPFGVSVQAINGRGDPMVWSGRIKINTVPGRLVQSAGLPVDVVDGVAQVPTVAITKAFGPTRIWAEDVGSPDKPGSYATGVSDVIWFKQPSIQDVQTSTSPANSPFNGQLVTITAGTMIVTQITGDGFYVTDTSVDRFNSIYVYARVRAEDLNRGMAVSMLSGAVSEYFGMTELTNPSWDAGEQLTVPAPIELDCDTQVSVGGMAMDRYEAGLVQVRNAVIQICDAFQGSGNDCADYVKYGQWTVTLPCGAKLNVITRLLVPRLDPAADQGKRIAVLRGILTQNVNASPDWILVPRDETDFCFDGDSATYHGACDPTP